MKWQRLLVERCSVHIDRGTGGRTKLETELLTPRFSAPPWIQGVRRKEDVRPQAIEQPDGIEKAGDRNFDNGANEAAVHKDGVDTQSDDDSESVSEQPFNTDRPLFPITSASRAATPGRDLHHQ